MTARKRPKKLARKSAKAPIRESLGGFEALNSKERIQKCVEVLPEVLGKWESSHPHWQIEVLLWILDASLKSLREYIDKADEPEISWDHPFVELHYPVQCSWHEEGDEHPSFRLVSGYITEKDVKSVDVATRSLARILVEQIQIVALQEFTNYTGFEKNGDEFRPVLDLATVDHIRGQFPPEDHEQEINRLFLPLSFGAGHVDYDIEFDPDGQETCGISEVSYEQIGEIREPLLEIPFDANGKKTACNYNTRDQPSGC